MTQPLIVSIFVGVAVTQLIASAEGLEHLLPDWNAVICWIVAFLFCWIPIFGAPFGVYGATAVWGWTWYWAIALFVGPWLVLIYMFLAKHLYNRYKRG